MGIFNNKLFKKGKEEKKEDNISLDVPQESEQPEEPEPSEQPEAVEEPELPQLTEDPEPPQEPQQPESPQSVEPTLEPESPQPPEQLETEEPEEPEASEPVQKAVKAKAVKKKSEPEEPQEPEQAHAEPEEEPSQPPEDPQLSPAELEALPPSISNGKSAAAQVNNIQISEFGGKQIRKFYLKDSWWFSLNDILALNAIPNSQEVIDNIKTQLSPKKSVKEDAELFKTMMFYEDGIELALDYVTHETFKTKVLPLLQAQDIILPGSFPEWLKEVSQFSSPLDNLGTEA